MLTSQSQNLNVLVLNLTCRFSLEIKRSTKSFWMYNITCSTRGNVFFVCHCLRTDIVFPHESESISLAKPLSPSLDVAGGSSADTNTETNSAMEESRGSPQGNFMLVVY